MTGTFAVVSLMTGLVVDQSGCSDEFADVIESTTVVPFTNQSTKNHWICSTIVVQSCRVSDTSSSDENVESDAVIKCKVGVAAMAAFIAGFYQVKYIILNFQ